MSRLCVFTLSLNDYISYRCYTEVAMDTPRLHFTSLIAGARKVLPLVEMFFRCSMAACICMRLEVSASCTTTSCSSSKVMTLIRSFGLSEQRREGREMRW